MIGRGSVHLPSVLRDPAAREGSVVAGEASEAVVLNVSRRSFVKTGTLAGAGVLVLGVFGCSRDEASDAVERAIATGDSDDAVFRPSVFVGINGEGDVFVVNSRAEMGQGVRSSVHVVIADELGADLGRVTQEQADGDPKYGDMNTDGSTTMRNFFDQWRTAGATAREMLIQAAAARWGVPAAECTAHDHAVHHVGSRRSAGFGELAAAAATLEAPADPPFRPREEWRYIGTAVAGYDNSDIVTGRARFGLDVRMPDLLYASVERPPTVLGRLVSFDDSAARAVPGVVDVVALPDAQAPVAFGALGGVAVVATNTWAAFKGREALVVQWELGPNAAHSTDSYRRTLEASASAAGEVALDEGDADAALSGATDVFEAAYWVPMQTQAPMEVPNATAWFKEDGTVECWAPTQNAISAREAVAGYLGLSQEEVTVHVTLLGGGFGRKGKADYIVEAALISRAVGAPVKNTWKREDCTRHSYFHAPSAQRITTAVGADGMPTAWRHRTAFPSISSIFALDVVRPQVFELGLGALTVPYDIANVRVEACEAQAHVRIGWMRSVGNIHHGFAVNAMAGELAQRAGRDQLEYFMELIGPDRDLSPRFGERGAYQEDLVRAPFDTARLKHVLRIAAQSAGYGNASLPANEAIGLAVHYSFGSYVAWAVRVRVEDGDWSVIRADGAIDAGTIVNRDRVLAQMEGNFIYGLTMARYGELTVTDGAVDQSNFFDYQFARLNETPEVSVEIVASTMIPGGVGEPGMPPVMPAISNGILQVTGRAVREVPIRVG